MRITGSAGTMALSLMYAGAFNPRLTTCSVFGGSGTRTSVLTFQDAACFGQLSLALRRIATMATRV